MKLKLQLLMFKYSNNYNCTYGYLAHGIWYLVLSARYYVIILLLFIISYLFVSVNYRYQLFEYLNALKLVCVCVSNSPERTIFRENSNLKIFIICIVFYKCHVRCHITIWKSVRFSQISSV